MVNFRKQLKLMVNKFISGNNLFAILNIVFNLIFQVLIVVSFEPLLADKIFIIIIVSFWIITFYQCAFESILSEAVFVKDNLVFIIYFFLIIIVFTFLFLFFVRVFFSFDVFITCAFGCLRGLQSYLNYIVIIYKRIRLLYVFEILLYIICILSLWINKNNLWHYVIIGQLILLPIYFLSIKDLRLKKVDFFSFFTDSSRFSDFYIFVISTLKRSLTLKFGSLVYNTKDFLIIFVFQNFEGLITIYNMCLRFLTGFYRGIIYPYLLVLQSDLYNDKDYSYHVSKTNSYLILFFLYFILIFMSIILISQFTNLLVNYDLASIISILISVFLYMCVQTKFYIYLFELTKNRNDFAVLKSNLIFIFSFVPLGFLLDKYILISLFCSQMIMSMYQYYHVKRL